VEANYRPEDNSQGSRCDLKQFSRTIIELDGKTPDIAVVIETSRVPTTFFLIPLDKLTSISNQTFMLFHHITLFSKQWPKDIIFQNKMHAIRNIKLDHRKLSKMLNNILYEILNIIMYNLKQCKHSTTSIELICKDFECIQHCSYSIFPFPINVIISENDDSLDTNYYNNFLNEHYNKCIQYKRGKQAKLLSLSTKEKFKNIEEIIPLLCNIIETYMDWEWPYQDIRNLMPVYFKINYTEQIHQQVFQFRCNQKSHRNIKWYEYNVIQMQYEQLDDELCLKLEHHVDQWQNSAFFAQPISDSFVFILENHKYFIYNPQSYKKVEIKRGPL